MMRILIIFMFFLSFNFAFAADDLDNLPIFVQTNSNKIERYYSNGHREVVDKSSINNSGKSVQAKFLKNYDFINIKHKSGAWIVVSSRDIPKRYPVDSEAENNIRKRYYKLIIDSFNCSLVTLDIELKNSKYDSSVYLNSEKIGVITSDGRLTYRTQGLCRNSENLVEGTYPKCDDDSFLFVAKENNQKAEGSLVPKCHKKKK